MGYRSGKAVIVLSAATVLAWAVCLGSCRGAKDAARQAGGAGAAEESAEARQVQPHTPAGGYVSLRPGETEALIIYSGAMHGMIEACGCEGNPSGGMTRELTAVERVRGRGRPTLYLNPGDVFPFDKRPAKMEFIAEAAAAMGYDAMAIGDQELIEGLSRFRELASRYALPYLSENLRGPDGERVAPGCVIKELAGIKVGIFSVLGDESYLYYKNEFLKDVKIESAAAAVRSVLDELEGRVDYLVLLSHQDKYLDRALASRFPQINLIVGGHDEELLANPVLVGSALRVSAGTAGDYVGVLHLAIDPRRHVRVLGNEIASATAQVPKHEKIERIYRDYIERSKEQPEANAEPLPEAYQSSETCEPCHKKIYEEYRKSKHATAWQTLVNAGRTEDRECWQCHTMGFGRKSGFRNIKETPELAGVSCQGCHLVTHDHNDRKIKDDLDYGRNQKLCQQCHTVVTSPKFNFWESFEKIDHHEVKEKSNDPPPDYKHWRVKPVHEAPKLLPADAPQEPKQ